MPYKRSSRIARHFPSPKIWPFGAKTEFFNTHAIYRQQRSHGAGQGRKFQFEQVWSSVRTTGCGASSIFSVSPVSAAEIIESDLWLQYQELGGVQDDEVATLASKLIPGYPAK